MYLGDSRKFLGDTTEIKENKVQKCGLCFQPSETKCSRCKVIYYCGVDCQRKHWPSHKKECKPIKPLKTETDKKPPEPPEGENVPTDGMTLKVKVAKSAIHGMGVFATKPIYLGEKVCYFHGKLHNAYDTYVRIRKAENGILTILESDRVFHEAINKGKFSINLCF